MDLIDLDLQVYPGLCQDAHMHRREQDSYTSFHKIPGDPIAALSTTRTRSVRIKRAVGIRH